MNLPIKATLATLAAGCIRCRNLAGSHVMSRADCSGMKSVKSNAGHRLSILKQGHCSNFVVIGANYIVLEGFKLRTLHVVGFLALNTAFGGGLRYVLRVKEYG